MNPGTTLNNARLTAARRKRDHVADPPMNRTEARRLAKLAVKRGAASGHQVRVARRYFAAAVRLERGNLTLEERAAALGIEVPKRKWTPGGAWQRIKERFRR